MAIPASLSAGTSSRLQSLDWRAVKARTRSRIAASVVVGVPVPVWDKNQGNILQAQAAVERLKEEGHRVRTELTSGLAEAFERYENNRVVLGYYRDRILPDLVRFYQGVYERYQREPAGPAGSPPGFADVVEDGRRRLACHLCGGAWEFGKLQCPFCGVEGARPMVRLTPDEAREEGYAIAACRECRGYIKELDRRTRWNGGPPLVEDWGSPHFDLIARRQEYWRPEASLVLLAGAT